MEVNSPLVDDHRHADRVAGSLAALPFWPPELSQSASEPTASEAVQHHATSGVLERQEDAKCPAHDTTSLAVPPLMRAPNPEGRQDAPEAPRTTSSSGASASHSQWHAVQPATSYVGIAHADQPWFSMSKTASMVAADSSLLPMPPGAAPARDHADNFLHRQPEVPAPQQLEPDTLRAPAQVALCVERSHSQTQRSP
jgi:hypothetical protein